MVEESLEIAAARAGDISQPVFQRMFARNPELEALFCLDTDGAVRGNMLAHAIRVLLDLLGERAFATSFLASEAITHAMIGIEVDEFVLLYADLRDVVRDLCGGAWTAEMAAGWHECLREIETISKAGMPSPPKCG